MSAHTPGPWKSRLLTRIYDDSITIEGGGAARAAITKALGGK